MKKKIILATVLAGIFGNPTYAVPPHAGFFVGINPGITAVDGSLRRDLNQVAFPSGGDTSTIGKSTPHIGLFMGYAWAPQPTGINIGAEVFARLLSLSIDRQDNYGPALQNFLLKFRSTNAFGATARLGYVCKESLLYVKLGVSSANWKATFQDALAVPAGFGTTSRNKNSTGVVAGLGIDHAIAARATIGVEYLFTYYNSIKFPANVGTFTFRPKVNVFNLRLKFAF
jgi:opacity protein-like surface antigen